MKLSKCIFPADKIDCLDYVISVGGVVPGPDKVKAILDWPQLRSLTTLRGFLGLTEFYRCFVRNHTTLAAPLTDLLRSTKFTWTTEANSTFTELKHKMTDMSVLALPNFTKTFTVETDASGVAIGVILSYLHILKESQKLVTTKNPDSRTTKLDFKIVRIQLRNFLQT